MEEKNYTGLIPDNEGGLVIDSASSEAFEKIADAIAFYSVAKERLTNVNRWHEIVGTASARFQLMDQHGHEVNRCVQKGDYLKVDIPGPGSKSGEGYDWVKVEELSEVSEQDVDSIGFRVRPASSPLTQDDSIAHFYSDKSTSTFIVTREKNKITAAIYDRNAKPNTDSENIIDKIRHVATGIGAILGGSKMQWKGLAKGLVKKE
jgi:hypothetical protein